MASTVFPSGIGPANSDIAAAVAAPSAATIAAAVAAPSAATIASAVAAPSSATIATAVAAAVPAIGAINTAVANNAPSPNNWVFLASGNLTNVSTGTASFTAYRKIRIVFNAATRQNVAEPQQLGLRLNGDSSNIYTSTNLSRTTGTSPHYVLPYIRNNNRFFMSKDTGNAKYDKALIGWMEIDNAASTGTKFVTSEFYYMDMDSINNYVQLTGTYTGASAITSVTLFSGNGVVFGSDGNTTAFQVWGIN